MTELVSEQLESGREGTVAGLGGGVGGPVTRTGSCVYAVGT